MDHARVRCSVKTFVAMVLVAWFGPARAYVTSELRLSDLVASADEAVAGTVVRVAQGQVLVHTERAFGATRPRQGSRVLIGVFQPTPPAPYPYAPPPFPDGIHPGEHRVFFLKRQDVGLVPVSWEYPSLQLSANRAGRQTDVTSWLAGALVEKMLRNAPVTGPVPGTFRPWDIDAPGDNADIARYIPGLPTVVTQPLLRRRLGVATTGIERLWLATALMNDHAMDGLPTAVPFFAAAAPRLPLRTNQAFLYALCELTLDDTTLAPTLAHTLKPLLDMDKPAVTQAVYAALLRNPSPDGVPMLARGEHAADPTTRALARYGLIAVPPCSRPGTRTYGPVGLDRFLSGWNAGSFR